MIGILYGSSPLGEEVGGEAVNLKNSPDNVYYNRNRNAYNNHGYNWKIKPEVIRLDFYVARQISKPFKLIIKKINNNSCNQ